MNIVTRFAPSPTGFLHIGSARTALFNWLYARHHQGKFLLRIEDTDRERSTQEAVDAILKGLAWLGLQWDDKVYYQSGFQLRHKEVAESLLAEGKAYYCYCSKETLEQMREKAKEEKRPFKYDGRCRHHPSPSALQGEAPVIRLKTPLEGETVIEDKVQGKVVVKNSQLDDMVLLRSDGSPTYMLAVVVDDHDMGITHIIRGDDHLTNASRQALIYQALGWDMPHFAHIPLIHGSDGAKLSKRHGALGVEAYQEMGYLPEALRNYLLRLGWGKGDEEIIPTEKAIAWFNLEGIGKSPARFDYDKLQHVNAHYIRERDNASLLELVMPLLEEKIGKAISPKNRLWVEAGIEGLKQRARTLLELRDSALFYVSDIPLPMTEQAAKAWGEAKQLVKDVIPSLRGLGTWDRGTLEICFSTFSEAKGIKLGKIMGAVRAAITRSHASPSMFDVMEILGKEETLARLGAAEVL